ncbi:DNA circularization N-terminal domain-containing protein [Aliivibrio fischeri]|uniref:DNA circularization N-terminal domain-containing protein n=1 Tax=Aliivibrio fischeri TaxID=668 RepID=UPI001F3A4734|nr:DNA circularization N-terminal domain-containing protein [Aliivibrio fischeri]MCE7567929.1 DNA circularization N-terminal domain-containing protein [Aliivibrio fischeri]
MWEREYEKGRWNGLELNILTTSINGGQRLHVSEIPYADLPSIKVMGSAANSIDLEVLLVGKASLVEANNLLASLNAAPKGELEHPWLGELPLVFETFSQKISTKRGVVELSLKFLRDGKAPQLSSSASITVSSKEQASEVEESSTKTFVQDVEEMDAAQVSSLQERFTYAINQLVGISTKLNVPSQTLSALNQELNSALVAISSIANAPEQFADQLSKTVDSVADAVRFEPDSENEAVDNSRAAQSSMLAAIDPNAPSAHYNVQMVTAAVKMSKTVATLEQENEFDIVNAKGQPSIMMSDLKQLTVAISQRVNEVTMNSTLESLELFYALTGLKEGIETQYNKVKTGSEAQRFIERGRYIPALFLAHQTYTDTALISALNSQKHPLFMNGTLSMRTMK